MIKKEMSVILQVVDDGRRAADGGRNIFFDIF